MTNDFSSVLDYLISKEKAVKDELYKFPQVYKINSGRGTLYRSISETCTHNHSATTPNGQQLAAIYTERQNLIKCLKNIQSAIKKLECIYRIGRPVDLRGRKNLTCCRQLFGDWDKLRVVPNEHSGKKEHAHKGIIYDSKLEVSIAEIYEMLNIPFLHGAIIDFGGYYFAADFVPLIEETGDYFIHEHCGINMTGKYLNRTIMKQEYMLRAGLIMGRDAMMTMENTGTFADKVYLETCINATITNILNLGWVSGQTQTIQSQTIL